jgi:hypothetical protein
MIQATHRNTKYIARKAGQARGWGAPFNDQPDQIGRDVPRDHQREVDDEQRHA